MKERTVPSTRQRRKASEKTAPKPTGKSAAAKSKAAKAGASSGTPRADVLLSISPPCMQKLANRKEDHEFRRYMLPSEVKRMWIYVSSPEQALRYIAIISPGKQSGEIADAEKGVSNADFNAGRTNGMPFAYEFLELYELKEPIPLSEMKAKYGISYPQRYMYTPQKMLDDIAVEAQTRLF